MFCEITRDHDAIQVRYWNILNHEDKEFLRSIHKYANSLESKEEITFMYKRQKNV